ncbi:ribonuclease PH [Oceanobacillus neutriphilus]|uniref:Ribonuclease PH n=1 Tax=Oceanobacillus neutriphilus TaxID=531815 RepID=A0ABQ2NY63_9BACI|nr:ribonuclease PH [Oceanobacillus neutriphilus]GGP13436.1 ribonuclease PH [Oceanobacillus neutriphilus]
MGRHDNRKQNELRSIQITPGYITHPEGSVLIEMGQTKVICNASIEDRVPPFMRGQGKGWITAEYAMLPRATEQRNIRESSKGKVSGRTMEIQRLIGRALRSVVDLSKIGERTIWIDCDVIQADGGTRTASITGAYVAMVIALHQLVEKKVLKGLPVTDFLAAISVGVLPDGQEVLDLNYQEDSTADVDMNIVMTGQGEFVELQGTGEEATFSMQQLQAMLALGEQGIHELINQQKEILGSIADLVNQE